MLKMVRGKRWIVLAGTVALAAMLVAAWAWLYSGKISDRSVLRQASAAAQQITGEERERAFVAILGQQAKQGYGADALETLDRYGKLTRESETADFAGALASNGDVSDAKKIVDALPSPKVRTQGIEAIAIAQADGGDLRGAGETSATLADHDQVERAISRYQVRSGDIEGALSTLATMPVGQDVNWLIVLSEDPLKADEKNLRKLALRIQDQRVNTNKDERWKWLKVWAEHFLAGAYCCGVPSEEPPARRKKNMFPASACAGIRVIEISGEPWGMALQAYQAGDVAGVETLLLRHPKDAALSSGLVIEQAIKRGDLANALRFAALIEKLNPEDPLQWRPTSARAIARAWAGKDKATVVVRWARQRPTAHERAMALLGAAEGMAQARPKA